MPEAFPLIQFRAVGKRFPGVVALQDVSFGIQAGACRALMGENGAGKSTLEKILAGVYRPDSGSVAIAGQETHLHTPLDGLNNYSQIIIGAVIIVAVVLERLSSVSRERRLARSAQSIH